MALDRATVLKTPAAGDAALSEVVRRLVEAYRPQRIYLFGSVAYLALWGTGVACDVLVWTASQFDSRLHLAASLPATVVREGKLLHAA